MRITIIITCLLISICGCSYALPEDSICEKVLECSNLDLSDVQYSDMLYFCNNHVMHSVIIANTPSSAEIGAMSCTQFRDSLFATCTKTCTELCSSNSQYTTDSVELLCGEFIEDPNLVYCWCVS